MKKPLVVMMALVLGAAAVHPQEVAAPFVSRFKTAVKGVQVKLTWTDTTDIQGTCLVYRHTSEINAATLEEATLVAEVPQGTESFVDTPPAAGNYYYAVLMRGADGRIFDLFIPFRNMTLRPVPLKETPTPQDLAASITGLTATANAEGIRLEYRSSRADRSLVVYRSTSPLTEGSLDRATLVTTLPSSQTTLLDYGVPGVPYYYAVLDERLAAEGLISIRPGENATPTYVEIPLGTSKVILPSVAQDIRRDMPLPYLRLSTEVTGTGRLAGDGRLTNPVHLSPETRKAAAALVADAPAPSPARPGPRLLDADKPEGVTPEELSFKAILEGAFSAGDWKNCEEQLKKFLSVPRSAEVKSRAYFYLGQALYFQEHFEASFAAFLTAREGYHAEVTPWLDAILSQLADYNATSGL